MYYGNLNALGRNFMGSRIDPDGAAYVAAVVAAGGTVDATQAAAVDTFYKSAKADGYYTSLKRLYLPIWGVAAANAIDMIGLTSGTFVGGVTHAAGFVQGNGSTGYFNMGTSPDGLSITGNGGVFGVLVNQGPSVGFKTLIGCRENVGDRALSINDSFGNVQGGSFLSTGSSNISAGSLAGMVGIFASVRENSTSSKLLRRKSSGILYGSLVSTLSALGCTYTITGMAFNDTGTIKFFSTASCGAFFAGKDPFTYMAAESFTLALKNLFEQSTGLTLP